MRVDSLGVLLRAVQGFPSVVPTEEVRNLANSVAPPPPPPPQAPPPMSTSLSPPPSSSVVGVGGVQDATLASVTASTGVSGLAGGALPLSSGGIAFDLSGTTMMAVTSDCDCGRWRVTLTHALSNTPAHPPSHPSRTLTSSQTPYHRSLYTPPRTLTHPRTPSYTYIPPHTSHAPSQTPCTNPSTATGASSSINLGLDINTSGAGGGGADLRASSGPPASDEVEEEANAYFQKVYINPLIDD